VPDLTHSTCPRSAPSTTHLVEYTLLQLPKGEPYSSIQLMTTLWWLHELVLALAHTSSPPIRSFLFCVQLKKAPPTLPLLCSSVVQLKKTLGLFHEPVPGLTHSTCPRSALSTTRLVGSTLFTVKKGRTVFLFYTVNDDALVVA